MLTSYGFLEFRGKSKRCKYSLQKRCITIGFAKDNDIRIHLSCIDEHHARIVLKPIVNNNGQVNLMDDLEDCSTDNDQQQSNEPKFDYVLETLFSSDDCADSVKVNGKSIKSNESVSLSSGDVLLIGERQFVINTTVQSVPKSRRSTAQRNNSRRSSLYPNVVMVPKSPLIKFESIINDNGEDNNVNGSEISTDGKTQYESVLASATTTINNDPFVTATSHFEVTTAENVEDATMVTDVRKETAQDMTNIGAMTMDIDETVDDDDDDDQHNSTYSIEADKSGLTLNNKSCELTPVSSKIQTPAKLKSLLKIPQSAGFSSLKKSVKFNRFIEQNNLEVNSVTGETCKSIKIAKKLNLLDSSNEFENEPENTVVDNVDEIDNNGFKFNIEKFAMISEGKAQVEPATFEICTTPLTSKPDLKPESVVKSASKPISTPKSEVKLDSTPDIMVKSASNLISTPKSAAKPDSKPESVVKSASKPISTPKSAAKPDSKPESVVKSASKPISTPKSEVKLDSTPDIMVKSASNLISTPKSAAKPDSKPESVVKSASKPISTPKSAAKFDLKQDSMVKSVSKSISTPKSEVKLDSTPDIMVKSASKPISTPKSEVKLDSTPDIMVKSASNLISTPKSAAKPDSKPESMVKSASKPISTPKSAAKPDSKPESVVKSASKPISTPKSAAKFDLKQDSMVKSVSKSISTSKSDTKPELKPKSVVKSASKPISTPKSASKPDSNPLCSTRSISTRKVPTTTKAENSAKPSSTLKSSSVSKVSHIPVTSSRKQLFPSTTPSGQSATKPISIRSTPNFSTSTSTRSTRTPLTSTSRFTPKITTSSIGKTSGSSTRITPVPSSTNRTVQGITPKATAATGLRAGTPRTGQSSSTQKNLVGRLLSKSKHQTKTPGSTRKQSITPIPESTEKEMKSVRKSELEIIEVSEEQNIPDDSGLNMAVIEEESESTVQESVNVELTQQNIPEVIESIAAVESKESEIIEIVESNEPNIVLATETNVEPTLSAVSELQTIPISEFVFKIDETIPETLFESDNEEKSTAEEQNPKTIAEEISKSKDSEVEVENHEESTREVLIPSSDTQEEILESEAVSKIPKIDAQLNSGSSESIDSLAERKNVELSSSDIEHSCDDELSMVANDESFISIGNIGSLANVDENVDEIALEINANSSNSSLRNSVESFCESICSQSTPSLDTPFISLVQKQAGSPSLKRKLTPTSSIKKKSNKKSFRETPNNKSFKTKLFTFSDSPKSTKKVQEETNVDVVVGIDSPKTPNRSVRRSVCSIDISISELEKVSSELASSVETVEVPGPVLIESESEKSVEESEPVFVELETEPAVDEEAVEESEPVVNKIESKSVVTPQAKVQTLSNDKIMSSPRTPNLSSRLSVCSMDRSVNMESEQLANEPNVVEPVLNEIDSEEVLVDEQTVEEQNPKSVVVELETEPKAEEFNVEPAFSELGSEPDIDDSFESALDQQDVASVQHNNSVVTPKAKLQTSVIVQSLNHSRRSVRSMNRSTVSQKSVDTSDVGQILVESNQFNNKLELKSVPDELEAEPLDEESEQVVNDLGDEPNIEPASNEQEFEVAELNGGQINSPKTPNRSRRSVRSMNRSSANVSLKTDNSNVQQILVESKQSNIELEADPVVEESEPDINDSFESALDQQDVASVQHNNVAPITPKAKLQTSVIDQSLNRSRRSVRSMNRSTVSQKSCDTSDIGQISVESKQFNSELEAEPVIEESEPVVNDLGDESNIEPASSNDQEFEVVEVNGGQINSSKTPNSSRRSVRSMNRSSANVSLKTDISDVGQIFVESKQFNNELELKSVPDELEAEPVVEESEQVVNDLGDEPNIEPASSNEQEFEVVEVNDDQIISPKTPNRSRRSVRSMNRSSANVSLKTANSNVQQISVESDENNMESEQLSDKLNVDSAFNEPESVVVTSKAELQTSIIDQINSPKTPNRSRRSVRSMNRSVNVSLKVESEQLADEQNVDSASNELETTVDEQNVEQDFLDVQSPRTTNTPRRSVRSMNRSLKGFESNEFGDESLLKEEPKVSVVTSAKKLKTNLNQSQRFTPNRSLRSNRSVNSSLVQLSAETSSDKLKELEPDVDVLDAEQEVDELKAEPEHQTLNQSRRSVRSMNESLVVSMTGDIPTNEHETELVESRKPTLPEIEAELDNDDESSLNDQEFDNELNGQINLSITSNCSRRSVRSMNRSVVNTSCEIGSESSSNNKLDEQESNQIEHIAELSDKKPQLNSPRTPNRTRRSMNRSWDVSLKSDSPIESAAEELAEESQYKNNEFSTNIESNENLFVETSNPSLSQVEISDDSEFDDAISECEDLVKKTPETRLRKTNKTPIADYKSNVDFGIKKLSQPRTPAADYKSNVDFGIKKLSQPKTPAADYKSNVDFGIKKLVQPKTPVADYKTYVDFGIKNLEQPKTPLANYDHINCIKSLYSVESPQPDYEANVDGIKLLTQPGTPKANFDSHLNCIKSLYPMESPQPDYEANVDGIKLLTQPGTPKANFDSHLNCIKSLYPKESPQPDYEANVDGIKQMTAPKTPEANFDLNVSAMPDLFEIQTETSLQNELLTPKKQRVSRVMATRQSARKQSTIKLQNKIDNEIEKDKTDQNLTPLNTVDRPTGRRGTATRALTKTPKHDTEDEEEEIVPNGRKVRKILDTPMTDEIGEIFDETDPPKSSKRGRKIFVDGESPVKEEPIDDIFNDEEKAEVSKNCPSKSKKTSEDFNEVRTSRGKSRRILDTPKKSIDSTLEILDDTAEESKIVSVKSRGCNSKKSRKISNKNQEDEEVLTTKIEVSEHNDQEEEEPVVNTRTARGKSRKFKSENIEIDSKDLEVDEEKIVPVKSSRSKSSRRIEDTPKKSNSVKDIKIEDSKDDHEEPVTVVPVKSGRGGRSRKNEESQNSVSEEPVQEDQFELELRPTRSRKAAVSTRRTRKQVPPPSPPSPIVSSKSPTVVVDIPEISLEPKETQEPEDNEEMSKSKSTRAKRSRASAKTTAASSGGARTKRGRKVVTTADESVGSANNDEVSNVESVQVEPEKAVLLESEPEQTKPTGKRTASGKAKTSAPKRPATRRGPKKRDEIDEVFDRSDGEDNDTNYPRDLQVSSYVRKGGAKRRAPTRAIERSNRLDQPLHSLDILNSNADTILEVLESKPKPARKRRTAATGNKTADKSKIETKSPTIDPPKNVRSKRKRAKLDHEQEEMEQEEASAEVSDENRQPETSPEEAPTAAAVSPPKRPAAPRRFQLTLPVSKKPPKPVSPTNLAQTKPFLPSDDDDDENGDGGGSIKSFANFPVKPKLQSIASLQRVTRSRAKRN